MFVFLETPGFCSISNDAKNAQNKRNARILQPRDVKKEMISIRKESSRMPSNVTARFTFTIYSVS